MGAPGFYTWKQIHHSGTRLDEARNGRRETRSQRRLDAFRFNIRHPSGRHFSLFLVVDGDGHPDIRIQKKIRDGEPYSRGGSYLFSSIPGRNFRKSVRGKHVQFKEDYERRRF